MIRRDEYEPTRPDNEDYIPKNPRKIRTEFDRRTIVLESGTPTFEQFFGGEDEYYEER